ncbi:hypothetical protein AB0I81_57565 [Nonomuraea sp. NPDC050404]|uniref:hypothetical protein n=1 Tax=Nonomuraea sp. NPDC050404 TaxID=3155783 RepID=UPI0033CCD5D5
MGDTFNITNLQAGNAVVGGSNNEISGAGRVEVHGDLDALRPLLHNLLAAIESHRQSVSAETRHDAVQALAELDQDSPEPGRIRRWIDNIVAGSGNVAAVADAAAKVSEAMTQIAT